jgi:SAM-dependent methyltransferase
MAEISDGAAIQLKEIGYFKVTNRDLDSYERNCHFKREEILDNSVVVDVGSGWNQELSEDLEKLNKGIKTISLDASLAIPPKGIEGVEYVKGGIVPKEVSEKAQETRLSEVREDSVAAVMPDIPLKDDVADLVVDCFGPGMYLNDEKFIEYIKEIKRVLKPDGEAHMFPVSYSQDDYKNLARNGELNDSQSIIDGGRRVELIEEDNNFSLEKYEQKDDTGRTRVGLVIKKETLNGSKSSYPYEIPEDFVGNEFLMENLETTYKCLKEVYPGVDFKIFDSEGSSAILYESDSTPGLVYKVAKFTDEYIQGNNSFGNEAKKMKIFEDHDLGPKLVKFHPEKALADIDLGVDLPTGVPAERAIIVMEKIDYEEPIKPIMSEEKFALEKNKLMNSFRELKMTPGDIELVWDKKREKIIVIDVAGVSEEWQGEDNLIKWVERFLI